MELTAGETIFEYCLALESIASSDCGVEKSAASVAKRAISKEKKRFKRFI